MPIGYGNSGKFLGNYWYMDIDLSSNFGDASESAGNSGFYLIHVSRLVSVKTIGFCLELNGKPFKYKVVYSSGHTVRSYEDEFFYDKSPLVYRLEKKADYDYSLLMPEEGGNGFQLQAHVVGNGLVAFGTTIGNSFVQMGTEGGNPHLNFTISPLAVETRNG